MTGVQTCALPIWKPFILIKETWRAFIPNQETRRAFILLKGIYSSNVDLRLYPIIMNH